METSAVLLVLLFGAFLKVNAAEEVKKFLIECDLIADCKKGPYCFGYSTKNAKVSDVCDQAGEFTGKYLNTECRAFGSFERTTDKKLKVKLIGASSYVAIIFAKSSGDLANDALFGIACRTDKTNKKNIQILQTPISEAGPHKVENGSAVAVEYGYAKRDGKWVVCEFELADVPHNGIDLTKGSYKVGLLIGQITNNRVQGGNLTSSFEALNIFSNLIDLTKTGSGGGGATELGAAFTLIVLGLIF